MSVRLKILLALLFLLLDAGLSWWLIKPQSATPAPVVALLPSPTPSLSPSLGETLGEIRLDSGRYQLGNQSFLNGRVHSFDSARRRLTLVSDSQTWSFQLLDLVKTNRGTLTDLRAGQIVWLGLTADQQVYQITFVQP